MNKNTLIFDISIFVTVKLLAFMVGDVFTCYMTFLTLSDISVSKEIVILLHVR